MNKRPLRRRPNGAAERPLVFSLLGTAHLIEARLEAAVGRVGLSLAKTGLLKHLAGTGKPVALSELAAQQQCVRSNITQLVDRLEKDGLVRRCHDPADRRRVRAELTAAGVRAYARGLRVLEAEQRAIVRGLSVGAAANFRRFLRLLAR